MPIASNYSLATPSHASSQVFDDPLLDVHGTNLIDTSWLDWTGRHCYLQPIPNMFNWGSCRLVHMLNSLPHQVLSGNMGNIDDGLIVH